MTIRHLQIFKAVCDCGSISLAAERLNITQPSVSIAVRELEAFYQVRLFDRIHRRIYLTEEGGTLRQYTETLLAQYDESVSVLRDGKSFTTCRIGANVSVAETYLPYVARTLREKIPDIKLKMYIHNNEQVDRLLTDNQIDFAIYDKISEREPKTIRLLFQDSLAACCLPELFREEKISLEELSRTPLLLREKGSGIRSCIDAEFMKYGYPQNIAAESTSTLGLIELAQIGMGCALLPRSLVGKLRLDKKLRIIEIGDVHFTKRYYLKYHNGKFLNTALRKAASVLEEMSDSSRFDDFA